MKRTFTSYPSGYVKASISNEDKNDTYSEELRPEIFEFLDACGNYTDYNQKVEDVAEQWNMTKDLAEDYVWNWCNKGPFYAEYDEDEEDLF